ncbi:hypothetical protein D9M70_288620 [compost metagenome]
MGASFCAATVTLAERLRLVLSTPPLAVPPVSRRPVRVITRAPVEGVSLSLR